MSFDKEEFTRALNARRAPLVVAKSAAAPEHTGEDAVEQRARATWRTNADIREEFLTESTYIAYCNAMASGRVRIGAPAPGLSRHTRAPDLSGS